MKMTGLEFITGKFCIDKICNQYKKLNEMDRLHVAVFNKRAGRHRIHH